MLSYTFMSGTHADVSWEDKTSLHTHSQVTQPLAYFPTMEKHQIIFFIDDKKAEILFFTNEWLAGNFASAMFREMMIAFVLTICYKVLSLFFTSSFCYALQVERVAAL